MSYLDVAPGKVIEPWGKEFAETIAPRITAWRNARSPIIEEMMRVQERYDGTWVLPELGIQGDARPLTPTYINDVVDGLSDRASSVLPRTFCPPLDPSKTGGRGSQDYATRRRQALGYAWFESDWPLVAGRTLRHLTGYANASMVVIPDMAREFPRMVARDPLHALPEPKAPEDLTPPSACAWVYGKSHAQIWNSYPEAREHIGATPPFSMGGTGLWDLVEYIDENYIYVGLLGPRDDITTRGVGADRLRPLCLRRWDNRAGRCTGIMLEAVTMSKIASQLFHLTGHADLMARLTALDIMASEQALLPDKFAIGVPGKTPRLVGGTWFRGSTGKMNLFEDVAEVGQLSSAPDPNNQRTQDRLESAFMRSSGVNGPMVGQTSGMAGQLRTGRGIDALLGASTDPKIAALHTLLAARMRWANEIAIDTYKGYWGQKKYVVFSGWPTDLGMVEFTPDVHLETNANVVSYPIPGADASNLTVAIGGLVGTELISLDTGRELHPWISNPEGEATKILTEQLDKAMVSQILARSQDPAGGLTPIDLAAIKREYAKTGDLAGAIEKADEAARARQAAIAPPAGPDQALAPEATPGLANPGEGAESVPFEPPPAVGPVAPSIDNVRRLNSALIGSSPRG